MQLLKFKIVLTEKGRKIFKGGNIEVMQPNLFIFEAESLKRAQEFFYGWLNTIGTSNKPYYYIEQIKGGVK